MPTAKGLLKVKSGESFVAFHPETSSDQVVDFREGVRENLPVAVYASNTEYGLDDCVFHEDLPKWAYLRCTTGGTTGNIMPEGINDAVSAGATITDGTVVWTVCKFGDPNDAKLKSIIANTITANSILYGTGANSFGVTALTTLARTLIGRSTAADMRSDLSAAAASHTHTVGEITNFASNVINAIGTETLSSLGVSYSINTNGYICFGELFGGLILQWGDPELISWPTDPETGEEIDHSGAIDITSNDNIVLPKATESILGGVTIGDNVTVDDGTISFTKNNVVGALGFLPAQDTALSDPVGTIVKYTGTSSTIPNGYLRCNGAEVSRTTYADLFAVIGTTYGAGNGTTTFNVPLLKDSDGNYCLIKAKPGADATDITDADGSPVGNIIKVIGTVSSLAGYLECDGSAVSRSEYADLFAVIGTTYGAGDGSTTFNLPNNQETGYTYFIKTEAEETPASNDAPTGTVMPFVSEGEVPEGYMLCDGSAINRIAYSKLFALIGTSYGVGNNVTTYNLPNITDSAGNYFIIKVGSPSEGDATIGDMVRYVGKTIPNGYLECDGSTVSRVQYSDLFAVIGESYGNGDGSTTFTLPNLKDSQNTYTYIIKTSSDAGPIDARGLYPHIYVTIKTAGATVTVTSNGVSAEYETDPDTGIRDYVIPTNGEW